jgi:hypothetical protein
MEFTHAWVRGWVTDCDKTGLNILILKYIVHF